MIDDPNLLKILKFNFKIKLSSVSTVSCTLQLQTPNPQNPQHYSQFKCNSSGNYLNLKYPTSKSTKVSFYCGDSQL